MLVSYTNNLFPTVLLTEELRKREPHLKSILVSNIVLHEL